MLLFITYPYNYLYVTTKFKYILCYCLSQISPQRMSDFLHLNTSYVIVYLQPNTSITRCLTNLNTSYVIVYRDTDDGKQSIKLI